MSTPPTLLVGCDTPLQFFFLSVMSLTAAFAVYIEPQTQHSCICYLPELVLLLVFNRRHE